MQQQSSTKIFIEYFEKTSTILFKYTKENPEHREASRFLSNADLYVSFFKFSST